MDLFVCESHFIHLRADDEKKWESSDGRGLSNILHKYDKLELSNILHKYEKLELSNTLHKYDKLELSSILHKYDKLKWIEDQVV